MQAAPGASLNDADPPSQGPAGTAPADVPPTRSPVRPRSRRAVAVLVAMALLAYALDQLAKVAAVAALSGEEPRELAGGLLTLRLTRNSGAAFSIAAGNTAVLSVVALVVVLVIVRYARRLVSTWWAVALGLLLGGATGNLTDRLVRSPGALRGHVVDFLELPHWPVFNVADMSIVTGGCLMVLLSLRGIGLDGTRADDHEHEHDEGGSAADADSGAGADGDVDGDVDGDEDKARRG